MVCLTSCVFRSIRFSGFARPHFGVRREGELYTQAQGGRKGGEDAPRDAHKLGKNDTIGRVSRPGKGAAAPGQARASTVATAARSALRRPFSPPISNGPLAAHGPPPLRESGPRMSCIYSGSRLRSTDRRHKSPRASQGHPLSNAAPRNLSSYHGQTMPRPI